MAMEKWIRPLNGRVTHFFAIVGDVLSDILGKRHSIGRIFPGGNENIGTVNLNALLKFRNFF